ncbi:hypothetical protein [Micromonospora okii]|uniref:hypothetical protein n=1 Tax=Micromonospora okii TaxID=1182970 RepID=UPI001E5CAB24|nr:hypothetical protein [Micromonospora okii]
MPEVDAARRLLRRLVEHLRHRGGATVDALAALALLASRLDHRPLAGSLTRLALRGEPVSDHRVTWLLRRLAEECDAAAADHSETPAATGPAAAEVLAAQHRRFVDADELDPINGAVGIGIMLWDVADPEARHELATALTQASLGILRAPSNGLYHGRGGGILSLRMLGHRYGRDRELTGPVDALVRDVQRLEPTELDTGGLGVGGVTLCAGLPGLLAALGPDADPAVLARMVRAPITPASLRRLDDLLVDGTADTTFCHGLAGLSLAMRLSPCWAGLVGAERSGALAARLSAHLDRVDGQAVADVFDTPYVLSVLSGPVGVALALAETATGTPPWWGIGVSLGDGTPAVAGTRVIGVPV